MKKRTSGWVALALGSVGALTWSGSARAQAFLRDPNIQQGSGITAGSFVLHPGLAAELGYDSNYLIRSYNSGFVNSNPEASGLVRVTPSLRFTTTSQAAAAAPLDADAPAGPRSQPGATVDGGLSASYREFFSGDLSNERNLNGEADAAVNILPGRQWFGSIDAGWTRIAQPSVLNNPDQSYDNDTVTGGVDVATQPNLGTLDWHFGYRFSGIWFENSVAQPLNNHTHQIYTRGRWRFRPRTALLYEGSASWHDYDNLSGGSYELHQSTPVRIRFGLDGLVTSRLSLMAMIGYAATFNESAFAGDPSVRQFDSIIGQAELRYFPPTSNAGNPVADNAPKLQSQLSIGGVRDVTPSYLNGFMSILRGYIRAEYVYQAKFIATLEGGVGQYGHPDIFFSQFLSTSNGFPTLVQMHTAYDDLRADATVFLEYRFAPMIGVNGTFEYAENFSDVKLPVDPKSAAGTAPPNQAAYTDQSWRRIQAYFGVRWLM
jgi:hypothetical protein